ncbi:MAG: FliI/YscN family ATPase [Myxococcota bacterium]|nr:FliI/YscN family ATPase [Myxococcota bacterium]
MSLSQLETRLEATRLGAVKGRVVRLVGTLIEAELPGVPVGTACTLGEGTLAEVVGFREGRALLVPLEAPEGVAYGSPVHSLEAPLRCGLGADMIGRVVDGLGRAADGGPPIQVERWVPVDRDPPDAMKRSVVDTPLETGIRVIDGLLTFGRGQRVGIMAGSGVGKSTLMGMLAKSSKAQVNVICLLGERGREVREFIERDLGPEGLARSVVVVVTSDKSPVLQVKGALTALSIAEHFRDQGQDVLLMMDSVTRFAMAQRQIGLAAGEPPTRGGYTPSVFAMLPRLLERAGPGTVESGGTITAVLTVLVDGDDVNDPIGDAVRGIVDGHVVLSRKLASKGHYPAVDVLASVSRVQPAVVTPEHLAVAQGIRRILADFEDNDELRRLGAYVKGSDPQVDAAFEKKPHLDVFLRQRTDELTECGKSVAFMKALVQA